MNGKRATEDDAAIGAAIRARRVLKMMSQEVLAEALGVTFQQVQKYEKGVNRVSGSRLLAAARALDCKVADLIADNAFAGEPATQLPRAVVELAHRLARLPDGQRQRVTQSMQSILDQIEASSCMVEKAA